MLTRMYYKDVYFFWNTTRNIDYDFVMFSIILACFFRHDCLLGNKECMADFQSLFAQNMKILLLKVYCINNLVFER